MLPGGTLCSSQHACLVLLWEAGFGEGGTGTAWTSISQFRGLPGEGGDWSAGEHVRELWGAQDGMRRSRSVTHNPELQLIVGLGLLIHNRFKKRPRLVIPNP